MTRFVVLVISILFLSGCATLQQMELERKQFILKEQEVLHTQGYATVDCIYLGGQSCAIEFVDGQQVYKMSSGSPILPSPTAVKFAYFSGKPVLGMSGVFSVMGIAAGSHAIGLRGISTPTGGQQASFSFQYDFEASKAYSLYFYWEKRKPLLSSEGLANFAKIPPFKVFLTERGSKQILKRFVSVSGSTVMQEDDGKIEENERNF
jgi:hypothetical protein